MKSRFPPNISTNSLHKISVLQPLSPALLSIITTPSSALPKHTGPPLTAHRKISQTIPKSKNFIHRINTINSLVWSHRLRDKKNTWMNTALFKKSPAAHGVSFWVAFFAGVVGGRGWVCGKQGKNISNLYLTTVERSCMTTSLKQIPPINTKIFSVNSLQSEPPLNDHLSRWQ